MISDCTAHRSSDRLAPDQSRSTRGRRYDARSVESGPPLGEEAIHHVLFVGCITEGTYLPASTTFIPRTGTSKGALIGCNPLSSGQRLTGFS